MRLPSDAALLIADEPRAADATAALLQAWREEALPLFRVSGAQRSAAADETYIVARGDDSFARIDLEARLDAIGATTLVFSEEFARGPLKAEFVLTGIERPAEHPMDRIDDPLRSPFGAFSDNGFEDVRRFRRKVRDRPAELVSAGAADVDVVHRHPGRQCRAVSALIEAKLSSLASITDGTTNRARRNESRAER